MINFPDENPEEITGEVFGGIPIEFCGIHGVISYSKTNEIQSGILEQVFVEISCGIAKWDLIVYCKVSI